MKIHLMKLFIFSVLMSFFCALSNAQNVTFTQIDKSKYRCVGYANSLQTHVFFDESVNEPVIGDKLVNQIVQNDDFFTNYYLLTQIDTIKNDSIDANEGDFIIKELLVGGVLIKNLKCKVSKTLGYNISFSSRFLKKHAISVNFKQNSISFKNEADLDLLNEDVVLKNYLEALKEIKLLHYENAITFLDKSLILKPDFYMAAVIKANVYFELKDYEKVQNCIEFCLKKGYHSLDLYLLKANLELINKNYNLSLKHVDKVLFWWPNNTIALNIKGRDFMGLNRIEEALVIFNRGIELEPCNLNCLANRSIIYSDLKKHELAEADLNTLSNCGDNESSEYNYCFGYYFYKKNNYQNAFEYFLKVDDDLENYDDFMFLKGKCAYKIGELVISKESFTYVINNQSSSDDLKSRTLMNMGFIFRKYKEFDKSLNCYNDALLLDSTNKEVYFNRSILFSENKKFELAEIDILKLKKIGYHDSLILYLKLYLDFNKGNYQEVVNGTKNIQNPNYETVYITGLSYFFLNNFDLAEIQLLKLDQIQPNYEKLNFLLGYINVKKRRYQNALKYYTLEIDKGKRSLMLSRAYLERAKVYLVLDMKEKSYEDFQKVMPLLLEDQDAIDFYYDFLVNSNRHKERAEFVDLLLEKYPTNGSYWDKRGRIILALDSTNFKDAKVAFQKGCELGDSDSCLMLENKNFK